MTSRNFGHMAQLIKSKRLAHKDNLSQSDLSHLLGYKNGQFISNVERGLCSIPLKMLKRVGQILDISATDLKTAIVLDFDETVRKFLEVEGTVNGVKRKNANAYENVVRPEFGNNNPNSVIRPASGE